MILRVLSVCCALLVQFTAITDAQYVHVSSASLSKAPVGFFNRRNIYGEVESASSLGGAPVGLYSKRHFPEVPVALPQVYPYPILPILNLHQFGGYVPPRIPFRPVGSVRKPPVIVRPPVGRPPVVSKPNPQPHKPVQRPPGGVSGRLLGGLFGGLFEGL